MVFAKESKRVVLAKNQRGGLCKDRRSDLGAGTREVVLHEDYIGPEKGIEEVVLRKMKRLQLWLYESRKEKQSTNAHQRMEEGGEVVGWPWRLRPVQPPRWNLQRRGRIAGGPWRSSW